MPITLDYLRRQAENPELTDAQVLQLHGCVWAQGKRTWIAPNDWQARAQPRDVEEGTGVVLGFDGSYNRDSTALVGCTLDGYVFVERLWQRPEEATVEGSAL